MTPAERALLLAVAKGFAAHNYKSALFPLIAAVEAEDDYHPEMRTFPSDNAHIVLVGNPDFKVQILGGGGGIGGEPLAEAKSQSHLGPITAEDEEALQPEKSCLTCGWHIDDDCAEQHNPMCIREKFSSWKPKPSECPTCEGEGHLDDYDTGCRALNCPDCGGTGEEKK